MFNDILSQPQSDSRVSRRPAVDQRLISGRQEFLGYLRRRLGSLDEAEDVLQNFCLKVVRSGSSVNQNEKINAWMGQILRHTLIDHYRRRAVRLRAENAYAQDPSVTDGGSDPDQGTGHRACLYAAIPRLRPDHAEILRRADLDEEPRARIAADMGLTANALNVRLHRARQALRRELETSCIARDGGKFMDCGCDKVRRAPLLHAAATAAD